MVMVGIIRYRQGKCSEQNLSIQSGTHLYVEMEGREGLGCAQLSITQVEDCYKCISNQSYKYNYKYAKPSSQAN